MPGSPKRVAATLAVAAALFWYFTGNLDKPLSQIHLNWTDCIEVFGSTYCADDAERIKQRLRERHEDLR